MVTRVRTSASNDATIGRPTCKSVYNDFEPFGSTEGTKLVSGNMEVSSKFYFT